MESGAKEISATVVDSWGRVPLMRSPPIHIQCSALQTMDHCLLNFFALWSGASEGSTFYPDVQTV